MPIRETPQDMLAKFDTITVEKNFKISHADRLFCENLFEGYQEAVAELKKWREQLEEIKQTHSPHPYKKIEREYQVTKVRSEYGAERKREEIDPFCSCIFTPDYGILTTQQFEVQAENVLRHDIEQHFNHTYNLRVSIPYDVFRDKDSDELKQPVSWETLVEFVIADCGGIDLGDMGKDNLRSEFRSTVWRKEHIIVAPKKLTITDYHMGWDTSYTSGQKKIGWNNKRMDTLRNAVSFFETGELRDICNGIPTGSDNLVEWEGYEMPNFSKISKIKFYKNNKMEMTFHYVGGAQEFYDFMELQKVKVDY